MRKILILIGILTLFIFAGGTALAFDEQSIIDHQRDAIGAHEVERAIPQEAQDLLDGVDIGAMTRFEDAVPRVFANTIGRMGSVLREAARNAALVMVVAVLLGLLHTVYAGSGAGGDGGAGGVPNFVPLVGVLAVSAVALGSSHAFIGLGVGTLRQLNDFSTALLPAMALAGTASGAFTAATVQYAGTALFLSVLMTVTERIVMPLIYAYIAASIGSAALGSGFGGPGNGGGSLGGDGLEGAANLLKWATGIIITAIMLAFVGYITVTGVVAGSADALTTRFAKTAISTALPVVGGIAADAAGTVIAGAAMVRNGIGVVGLLAVLALCLLPTLQLGTHYLLFKLAGGLSGAVSDRRLGSLIGSLGTAFGMVMGLTGAGAMMLFFAIISMMRVVTA